MKLSRTFKWRSASRQPYHLPGKESTGANWILACGATCVLLATCSVRGQSNLSSPARPGEKLVWADEFNPSQDPRGADPANWKYDHGGNWDNNELETYCVYGSEASPCVAKLPNSYIGSDGYLHLIARKNGRHYTSARINSQELQSFQYGRIEARIKIPAGQGLWPAFWMLGDNDPKVGWPACGELDIMENIGKEPDEIHGSVHGVGFIGSMIGQPYQLSGGQAFSSAFHRFGLLWSPDRVQFYVDDPDHPYATFTPSDLPKGAKWPFEDGKFFLLLNLAVGGDWPGNPDSHTQFPAEMLVDYVRVWQRGN